MKGGVMLAVRPEWCEKILNGEKTIEIRKTRPRLQLPFKVYIYCTRAVKRIPMGGCLSYCEDDLAVLDVEYRGFGKKYGNPFGFLHEKEELLNQRVIAEFTCGKIEPFGVPFPAYQGEMRQDILERSCVNYQSLHEYAQHRTLYSWEISELTIYEKPRSISDFFVDGPAVTDCPQLQEMKRPPQSWCYVEGCRAE